LRILPIATDGWRFILPLGVLGAAFLALGRWWSVSTGLFLLVAGGFCAFFFRDFDRLTPADDYAIYSPGDGKILEVGLAGEGEQRGWRIVRIFLSVFDGHVQRSPVKGRVTKIDYKKGTFLDARDIRAHIDNEQNAVSIESGRGVVVVKQIAGLIARRIVCWVRPGGELEQGQRYGLIRFGSQVDVLMPESVEVLVKPGERVVGGETVLARWRL